MPLINGVDSFAGCSHFKPSRETLVAFFGAYEFFLTAFRENPSYQMTPYEHRYNAKTGGYSLPSGIPTEHPILSVIISQKLMKFGPKLATSTGWSQVARDATGLDDSVIKSKYAAAYALIDMACYLIYLLNIYIPYKALIQNVISVNTTRDALGRENFASAEVAIAKIICRSTKQSYQAWDSYSAEQAADLIVIAKIDAAQQIHAPSLKRGIGFEQECELKLKAGGFDVQVTPVSGDFGADLLAIKDDLGYAIQCKDTSKPVGLKAIQEAVAARSHYKVDFAVVCAPGGFTDAAIELATSNKVILCNADQLVRRLDSI